MHLVLPEVLFVWIQRPPVERPPEAAFPVFRPVEAILVLEKKMPQKRMGEPIVSGGALSRRMPVKLCRGHSLQFVLGKYGFLQPHINAHTARTDVLPTG